MGNLFLEMALKVDFYEQVIQSLKNDSIRRAERALHSRMRGLFSGVFDEVMGRLDDMTSIPSSPTGRRLITNIIENAHGQLNDILSESSLDAAQAGRNRVISELQRQGQSLVFSEISPRVRDMIQAHTFRASDRTTERLVGNVMDVLTRGYEDGLGIDAIKDRLKDTFDGLLDHELERIARTEINSIQNQGAYETEIDLGVEYHMWVSEQDPERTRATHFEQNSQIVRIGDTFENGLRYPGDRSGDEDTIGEWINCRCRLVPYIMPLGKKPPTGRQWFYERDLVAA